MTGQQMGGRPILVGLPGVPLPEWRISVRCRGCNRWLTDPSTVAAGIGPTCATREAGGAA